LRSSSSGPWSISGIDIPAGYASQNFYYKDTKSGTKTLTVSSTGLTQATQQITITSASANHFGFYN